MQLIEAQQRVKSQHILVLSLIERTIALNMWSGSGADLEPADLGAAELKL